MATCDPKGCLPCECFGLCPHHFLSVLRGFCLEEGDIWLLRLTDGWSTGLGVELLGEWGGSGASRGGQNGAPWTLQPSTPFLCSQNALGIFT